MTDWQLVREYAELLNVDADRIIREAMRRQMSAEQVVEAYERAAYLSVSRSAITRAEFEEFAAVPPGFLDIRCFDQSVWWVDIMRVPHRISELDDLHLNNVVGFLIAGAPRFRHDYRTAYPTSDPGRSAGAWLETRPLMQRLRVEQRIRVAAAGMLTHE